MRKVILSGAALLTLALMSVVAYAQMPKEVMTHKTDTGETVLTNSKGMTLYTFDKDMPDKSNCNGPCATNWPPLMAAASDANMGEYTVITRNDGAKQWAYKGKALYTWSKDTKPGETSGNGMGNGAWHTAMP